MDKIITLFKHHNINEMLDFYDLWTLFINIVLHELMLSFTNFMIVYERKHRNASTVYKCINLFINVHFH